MLTCGGGGVSDEGVCEDGYGGGGNEICGGDEKYCFGGGARELCGDRGEL